LSFGKNQAFHFATTVPAPTSTQQENTVVLILSKIIDRQGERNVQVELSNTEGIVQLTIALNFAFAAFDSLRSPVQSRMQRLASRTYNWCVSLSTELRYLHYVSTLDWPEELSEAFRGRSSDYSKIIVHTANLGNYENAFEQSNEDWSFSVGRFAIFVGTVGLAVLFAIPVLDDLLLPLPLYSILIAFLLCSTLLLIFYNLSISQMMRDEVKKIETVRQEVFEIEGRLKSEYRPNLRRSKEIKLISEQ